jgi:hypothetical protein
LWGRSRACSSFSSASKGLVGQTINSAYYRDVLWWLHENVCDNPPYFPPFLRLKIKLKGRHFDTTEVIDAELQAVLVHSRRTQIPGCI